MVFGPGFAACRLNGKFLEGAAGYLQIRAAHGDHGRSKTPAISLPRVSTCMKPRCAGICAGGFFALRPDTGPSAKVFADRHRRRRPKERFQTERGEVPVLALQKAALRIGKERVANYSVGFDPRGNFVNTCLPTVRGNLGHGCSLYERLAWDHADFNAVVGRAILPAAGILAGPGRLKRRLQPGLAAPLLRNPGGGLPAS
jgi:hypothetical protein